MVEGYPSGTPAIGAGILSRMVQTANAEPIRPTPTRMSRRRQERRRDVSVVMSTPAWRENPGFVHAALATNSFVSCGAQNCGKVIGVGVNMSEAEKDAQDNNTGIRTDDGWRCEEHAGENA